MTSKDLAITLTKANLHSVFGEKDIPKRLKGISSLWVPDGNALFIDSLGVFKTHQAISDMVSKIQNMGGAEDTFVELSDVECLAKDEEGDLWVTRVKWGVGPSSEELTLMGWDVLTIMNGKIKACYTFLDSK